MMDRTSITQTVKKIMPKDVEMRNNEKASGYWVDYSWKLNNDPKRPNKKSKIISVKLSEETLEDFSSLSDDKKLIALGKLERLLKSKMEEFEPDHDSPINQPPVEEWEVTSAQILG